MNAYKIELLVVDHENCGRDDIACILSNVKYIHPTVLSVKEANIGEWSDNHLLNKLKPSKEILDQYFKD
jgi:hypothetical protein